MDMKEKKIEKILSEIDELRRNRICSLLPAKFIECDYKRGNELPEVTDEWKDYVVGQRFGGYDKHFWINLSFVTPSCKETEEIRFALMTSFAQRFNSARNPQCILYVNGKISAGLDLNHTEYCLKPSEKYEIYIYLYTGLYNSDYDLNIGLIKLDRATDKLYYDIKVPFETAILYGEDKYEHIETIKHLDIAVNFLDFTEPYSEMYYKGVDKCTEYLDKEYYGKYPEHYATVDCIGHTHIDVAWLWKYNQTREKVQRSFSTVVHLMKKYPEYRFFISQPQLLEYLKEEAPEVFDEIKRLVKEGKIEVGGAMWLEADCNLPSGESLVRQIIFGKKYFKDEFGIDSKVLWLPDVFGYSAAVPQIMRKTGVEKFITSKLGWNEFNQIPYDIFEWIGIDGSRVSAHFMTCQDITWENKKITSYCEGILPKCILGTWERQQQKEYTDEVFMTYGYGDGGGGPTEEMLEYEARTRRGILGLPKTKLIGATESIESIDRKFHENADKIGRIPTWNGELYLEFHRGTYTSVGKVKRYNRKGEFLAQNAEKISVLSMLLLNSKYNYEIIRKSWKSLLLNQFHDVIPGSSAQEVYEDCYKIYDETISDLNSVIKENLECISGAVKGNGRLLVFNPNAFETTGVIKHNDGYITIKNANSMGWVTIEATSEKCEVLVEDRRIENKYYIVKFDDNYDIISIFDKLNNREVIKTGKKANEFVFYEDLPYSYDAWELSVYHKDKKYYVDELISCEAVFEGARAGFRIVKRFRNSFITQNIYLYNSLTRIDFDTVVDWNLRHIIFKAAFPVDVNTNKATYEIQFGNVERTHTENTSWDIAKFETCAHKWVDIADNGYGLALMNDCKYGYSVIDGSTIQLSILRSGNSSIEEVNDQGEHRLSYSIIPHKGNYIDANIVKEAYLFNNPLICKEIENSSEMLPDNVSLIRCDNNSIIIDTVKRAEDDDSIVIRLYESQNKKDKVKLHFGISIKEAYICDMLENELEEMCVEDDNSVSLDVLNFEIITLKVKL